MTSIRGVNQGGGEGVLHEVYSISHESLNNQKQKIN